MITEKAISPDMAAHKENKYINLNIADNGFVLRWEECTPTKDDYPNYTEHQEIYKFDEFEKASRRMIKLHAENMKWKYEASMMKEEKEMLLKGLAGLASVFEDED